MADNEQAAEHVVDLAMDDEDSQDEAATMALLQNPTISSPSDPVTTLSNLSMSHHAVSESEEEKQLAKRHPPHTRIGFSSYTSHLSSQPDAASNPLAGVEGFESVAATPTPTAPAPASQTSYVYESAAYSPSFPSTLIIDESEEPPVLSLSPAQHASDDLPSHIPASPPPQEATQTLTEIVPTESAPSATTGLEEPVESSVVSTEPPQSNIERLSTKLKEHPDDGAIWQIYINLVDQSGDMDLIESAYERLVEAFPNQATAQITYLSHYLSRANFPKAEALFARFLRPSPSVDLWKFYLIYIRRVNPNPNEANSRNTIKKAYEFALNHVGQDKDAGDIWKDYIDFLKSTEPATTWDAQQRMDALRSAYHRAVVIPVENVETLWRDLDAFENSLNKITAKKFLGDLSPSYMTARTSLRDLRRLMEPLSIPPIKLPSGTAAASLPLTLPARPTWIGDSDRNLTQAWKAYLKWEESNPLDADEATLYARVSSAYRKAVMRMRFFPEIWYMAYNHLNNNAKQDEATTLLKQGMDANPSSFLLHFAYAELCESLHQVQEAQGAFENLIKSLHTQLESIEAGIATEVAAARDSVPQTDGANPELALERDEREKAVVDRHTKELDVMRGELGVVWIMWMRFARRAQGLRPARGIFTQARKDKFCPWSVYEAAALMEYHASKSGDVSTKIFELGMKQFGTDVDFVIRYLGFLISINDDINGRALFESAIGNFTGEKARPLWERWARYEYNFGDFAATQKLKARITEAYPNDPPLKHFAQRYAYHGVDAIAGHDLGFAVRNKPQPPGRGATTSTNAAGTSQQPPTAPAADRERERERATAPVPPPRRSSPDPRTRRREPSPPPAKRFKPSSPPPPARRNDRPLASRDRERWDENTPRRVASPAQGGLALREPLPTSLHWFIGLLPPASSFDGPIFRTEDMMELLKHGNIPPPSSQGSVSRPRSPPPPRGPPPRGRRY